MRDMSWFVCTCRSYEDLVIAGVPRDAPNRRLQRRAHKIYLVTNLQVVRPYLTSEGEIYIHTGVLQRYYVTHVFPSIILPPLSYTCNIYNREIYETAARLASIITSPPKH